KADLLVVSRDRTGSPASPVRGRHGGPDRPAHEHLPAPHDRRRVLPRLPRGRAARRGRGGHRGGPRVRAALPGDHLQGRAPVHEGAAGLAPRPATPEPRWPGPVDVVSPQVEAYMTGLLGRHDEPVLLEMEAEARSTG